MPFLRRAAWASGRAGADAAYDASVAAAQIDRLLDEAQRICAVPAPTFAEADRAQLVARMFAETGTRADIDAVGNVVCRIGGDGPAAVFAAHLDTVFGLEQPIEISHRGGRIAAPGIGDNSLAVAGLLHLARHLAEDPPRRPVVLAATVGEEGLGDLRGANHLVASVPCDCFVAVEGMSLQAIEVGGIGSQRLRVTYSGPGGHSWSDRGTPSAIHGLTERAAALLAGGVPPSGAVNVGRLHGGTSINTIAAEATLELDLRSEDPAELETLARRATDVFASPPDGLRASVQVVGRRPAGSIDPDHPLIVAARRARSRAGLEEAEEGASSTDANAAYGRGIPAITVGLTTGANAHRADEYIDVEPVDGGLRALELLADELADR
jgi:acetylornithine deacetylase/succinyl-diaminopimelate desuccinylase-like protein